jgi:hypothetical protein
MLVDNCPTSTTSSSEHSTSSRQSRLLPGISPRRIVLIGWSVDSALRTDVNFLSGSCDMHGKHPCHTARRCAVFSTFSPWQGMFLRLTNGDFLRSDLPQHHAEGWVGTGKGASQLVALHKHVKSRTCGSQRVTTRTIRMNRVQCRQWNLKRKLIPSRLLHVYRRSSSVTPFMWTQLGYGDIDSAPRRALAVLVLSAAMLQQSNVRAQPHTPSSHLCPDFTGNETLSHPRT